MMSAAAVVLWAASMFAQNNAAAAFNGKWTAEMPAAGAAGGGGGAAGGGGGARGGGGGGGRAAGGGGGAFNCGMTCDVAVTQGTIKVSRAQGDQTVTWNCTLDGKDCTNEVAGRNGGAPTQVVAQAKWDGNKIVITRKVDNNGTAVTMTQTLSVEQGKLNVVSTSTMEGAQPRTQTYTKG